ncbi:lytic transglycosylase domain-containing protein [Marivita sp. GX14005]|uniref:lytic transglycosylase domain-containing protein n=1 Tax=Marivita sp. GX14005 TaxID=2942276 RepID=UPI002019F1D1|nr:lytic transglycosylase domain-containing protein [Marivita sp. GX14005]MCL3880896.1 lytic transglycosylase domain-containing protein [Marivita sp. GX14005]
MKRLPALTLCALALCAPHAFAEPPPFPEFSAKRVKPPKPGVQKRITVQIAPRAPEPDTPRTPQSEPRPSGSEILSWFWAEISPSLDAQGPGRLEPALVRLSNPPAGEGVAAPRLQDLQDIAARYGADILLNSAGTRVSPALALAVIAVESAGRFDAASSAGAQGLMQLMPDTAARFGVQDSLSPAQNIRGGIAFLDFLMTTFDNDVILALAGYNAGENAVLRSGGVPDYAETRVYVPKVLQAFQLAKGLCLTPPQLVTDGCVFRVASR